MVIEKEGEVYRQYRIENNGSRKHVATFNKFTDGNPDDLWEHDFSFAIYSQKIGPLKSTDTVNVS